MAITVKKKSVTVKTVKAAPQPQAEEAVEASAPDNVLPAGVASGPAVASGSGGSSAGNIWASLVALAAIACVGVLLFLQWSEYKDLSNAFPGDEAVLSRAMDAE